MEDMEDEEDIEEESNLDASKDIWEDDDDPIPVPVPTSPVEPEEWTEDCNLGQWSYIWF